MAAFLALTGANVDVGDAVSAQYTVAFNQPNGLPANVDRLVAAAGGTITVRLPEVGGIGVESSNPSFAAEMAAHPSVKAADASVSASIPQDRDAGVMSAENN